jgi:signal peptidase I
VGVVLVSVILALFVRTFLVQAFVVPSGSMEETVLVGDHLLVNKFLFGPHGHALSRLLPHRDVRRGDIIVFKFPKDPTHDYIKRVVALPGDVVEIRAGTLFVNGVAERLPATGARGVARAGAGPADGSPRDYLGPIRIPAESYFAMGDNRRGSYDSRFWGPVPAQNLKGRALWIYWSSAPAPPGGSANPIRWLAGMVRSTRFSRTFQPVK